MREYGKNTSNGAFPKSMGHHLKLQFIDWVALWLFCSSEKLCCLARHVSKKNGVICWRDFSLVATEIPRGLESIDSVSCVPHTSETQLVMKSERTTKPVCLAFFILIPCHFECSVVFLHERELLSICRQVLVCSRFCTRADFPWNKVVGDLHTLYDCCS